MVSFLASAGTQYTVMRDSNNGSLFAVPHQEGEGSMSLALVQQRQSDQQQQHCVVSSNKSERLELDPRLDISSLRCWQDDGCGGNKKEDNEGTREETQNWDLSITWGDASFVSRRGKILFILCDEQQFGISVRMAFPSLTAAFQLPAVSHLKL